jgi:hypothetical protein
MKIRKNGKVINLTESDLRRITKKVLSEQKESTWAKFKKNVNYITGDVKKAFAETGEIPASFGKYFDELSKIDVGELANTYGEEVKKEAEKVWKTVTSWFNESTIDPDMQDKIEAMKDNLESVVKMNESYRRVGRRSTGRRFRY